MRRLTETDQGDYTCTVKSSLTDSIGDRIVYELIVQTPPVAPVLSIKNITYNAIKISWMGARLVGWKRDRFSNYYFTIFCLLMILINSSCLDQGNNLCLGTLSIFGASMGLGDKQIYTLLPENYG